MNPLEQNQHIQSMIEELQANSPNGDNLRIHGYIYVRTFDPTSDETRDERLIPNLITYKGFNKYLESVFNSAPSTVLKGTFIGIGTGTGAPAIGDTALGTEISVARGAGTYTHTADTAQGTVAFTFGTGGPWAITEMGLFDATSSGTMLCRGTFSAVNKGTADSFEAKYIHSLS